MLNRRTLLQTLALLAATPSVALAAKQTMTIVVPYPPGGPLDSAARAVAEALKGVYGTVIVENKPGAAGARGMQAVKNAKPDGNTMVMGAVATLATNPALFDDLPYKPEDFAPVANLCHVPNVLVMAPKRMKELKIKTAGDLINYIKANPGKVNFASGGNGSAGHMAGEIMIKGGLKMTHIPYKGAAPGRFSVIKGETDMIMDNYASCRQAIADGQLIPLAVTINEPFAALKDVPTLSSLGFKMDISTWFGLVAPKATPKKVIDDRYNAIANVMKDEKLQTILASAGGGVRLLDPKAYAKFIAEEQVRYRDMIKTLGISMKK